ncbi:MAG: DUF3298 and DUF4163 domain-containing protein [Clostridia bacterium]|nr:DUF3298 and DUF4163 domain-containing protein [Clostridia bacterium]
MQLSMSGETIETLLYRNETPVLELKICYPQIIGPLPKRSEFRFNGFYCNQARNLNRRARTEFYHNASEESRIADEEEYGFTLHSLIRSFFVTRLDPRYCSIALDQYQYFGGTHGMTVRIGNTWDLSTGSQVPLSYFFYENIPYRKQILNCILKQIEVLKEKEEISFFENPLRKAKQYFDEKNYYLTNRSIVIFYPLYTLAPYHAGIVSFEIPFEHLNGWVKERKPTETAPYRGSFSSGFEEKLL